MSTLSNTWRRWWNRFPVALVLLPAVWIGACERESQPTAGPPPTVSADSPIVFPPEVRSDDPAVNEFVRRISETCVEGDYEKFRLLWAVREDPFPRQEFERGRKALEKVRIADLQKMKTPKGEYLYYIHARIELDESLHEPARDVVMLIVKEDDRWRLARAPDYLRKKVLGTSDGDPGNQNALDSGSEPPLVDPTLPRNP